MTGEPLARALPGPMIDLIRDGVPARELAERGQRAVWSALVRTAASAYQRGWDRIEWDFLLAEPASHLGTQARTKAGRPRTPRQIRKTLDNAWDAATVWVSEQPPPRSRDQVRAHAEDCADAAVTVAADPEVPLTTTEREILVHAASEARRRGTDRVALPRRAVVSATGRGEREIRTALDRLSRVGLLTLEDRGRPGGPAAKERRAALYRLPGREAADAYLYRETRHVGPPAQSCGTPPTPAPWDPHQFCGTPDLPPAGKESVMAAASITFNLSPEQAAEVAAVIARFRQAEADPPKQEAADVVDLATRRKPA